MTTYMCFSYFVCSLSCCWDWSADLFLMFLLFTLKLYVCYSQLLFFPLLVEKYIVYTWYLLGKACLKLDAYSVGN